MRSEETREVMREFTYERQEMDEKREMRDDKYDPVT